jgi:hypothetical protein
VSSLPRPGIPACAVVNTAALVYGLHANLPISQLVTTLSGRAFLVFCLALVNRRRADARRKEGEDDVKAVKAS